MTDRIDKLGAALRNSGMAALAIVPGANLRYLAGLDMHMNERLTVAFFPAEGQPAVVLPALEAPRAQAQARLPMRFYTWDDAEGPYAALRRCTGDLGLDGKRIGVEYTTMRVLELRGIEQSAEVQAEDATPLLASLRMVKDASELAAMREAARIVEQALRAALEQARVGMPERELAAIWDAEMRAAGGERTFTTIAASGPNSANPHHTSGERTLQPGDLVILDGGAFYDGYQSDITRTVAVGQPSDEARRIYELVQAANAAGRAAAAQPGATGESIDQAARKVIEDGGYGQYFLHRTGHGLGMEVHEPPYIVGGSRDPLPAGATFTIEPGVYVEGVGGVRIEDDVIVTADGAESLTSFERDLIIVKS
jgi:Xaa-Pro dipeptidase